MVFHVRQESVSGGLILNTKFGGAMTSSNLDGSSTHLMTEALKQVVVGGLCEKVCFEAVKCQTAFCFLCCQSAYVGKYKVHCLLFKTPL